MPHVVRFMTTASFQNMLFVEIPEYRNKHIRVPVKVNFYVINGKRKRSQPQHFTYHPGETLSLTILPRTGGQLQTSMLCSQLSSLGRGLPPSQTVFSCVGRHVFLGGRGGHLQIAKQMAPAASLCQVWSHSGQGRHALELSGSLTVPTWVAWSYLQHI